MSDEKVYRRFRAIGDEQMNEGGRIRLLASTDEAVSWGNWREVLRHEPGCVDMSAARSLLVNHDPDQLAGGISEMSCDGRQMVSDAEIDEDARMRSGVSVRKAVKKRQLNGVSIGYTYRQEDTDWDDATRTLTVRKWRLLEISLTPIPADARAQVRSIPNWAGISDQVSVTAGPPTTSTTTTLGSSATVTLSTAATPAAPQKETRMSADINKPNTQGPETADKVDAAVISEKARAEAMAEAREVAQMARSVGLDAADFAGKSKAEAQVAMLRALADKNKPEEPTQPAIRVGVDATDKARDAFAAAMLGRVGFAEKAGNLQGNPMAGRSILDQIRVYAGMTGIRGAGSWSRQDLAHFALGQVSQIRGEREAANVITADFPNFVFLNAISKSVAAGFEMGSKSIKHGPIVSRKTVPDFKSFYIGGLGTGNLQKTAENVAFPELAKYEGAYNDTVKMWGGTLSLTMQALVNDDTSEFDRSLRSAGLLALKAQDRRVFQKLLMGTSAAEGTSTWTSNTTSGCTIVFTTADTLAASRANLGKGRAALMNKTGLDGNPLGNMPRFLICGPTNETNALTLFTPTGGQVSSASVGLEVVATPWLEASALTGYSTTSYYLLAEPNEATGLVLTTIAGMESPQVQEYDAGAVAAKNWKIFQPFEADLFWFTGTDGSTKVIPAAQQCTT